MSENSEKIEKSIKEAVMAFTLCNYPKRPLYYFPQENQDSIFSQLCIRIPPFVPRFLREKYPSMIEKQLRACIGIESIVIKEEYRKQGAFDCLVNDLLDLQQTQAITITNVINREFAEYFTNSKYWVALKDKNIPTLLYNFYTTKSLFRK